MRLFLYVHNLNTSWEMFKRIEENRLLLEYGFEKAH